MAGPAATGHPTRRRRHLGRCRAGPAGSVRPVTPAASRPTSAHRPGSVLEPGSFPSASQIQAVIDGRTKPVGSLGRLEEIAVQLGVLQGTTAPSAQRVTHTIIAADHGIAAQGVSAYPPEVTRLMLSTFLSGGAAACVIAGVVGARLRVVDAGCAGQPLEHPDLVLARLGAGTADSSLGPAMSAAQCAEALAAGARIVTDDDAEVVSLGEMGIGNTSAAALVSAAVLGIPIDDVVGRGTGVDDAGLARKRDVLRRAAARVPGRLGGEEALREFGGFEIAMLAGSMLGAARARRLVLVDGFVATAAAVAALDLDPGIRPALVFAHRSAESGHLRVLDTLAVRPLLDLGMRLGEGTGALLAVPLVRAAAATTTGMAALSDLGVGSP
jgi:nicotinate-nucleotide--dimethylbenzimidazole phosphoribosyltransferase